MQFIQNLTKSPRYCCNFESWIQLGLEELDGEGYIKKADELSGIFGQGFPYRFEDLLQMIEKDIALLSTQPLVVLSLLRYIAQCAFYFLNSHAAEINGGTVLHLIGLVYSIGSKMNWSWLNDLISDIHLDAVANKHTTQSNLSYLIDVFCAVAAAWRSLGHLGGFDASKLIKNHDLKELWLTFVICALVTIITQINKLEKDFETLDTLFDYLNGDNNGMLPHVCVIVLCYFVQYLCLLWFMLVI